ncbi:hypothetical protein [Roseibium sediminicola]|uniref:Uncharacterized protein n=1 Tax=Roseibium sediminicola TaxID=2933272 RepID=A0ABT0GNV0_9HYPH|nr:hypothetical protein [Roseibium sp. CAU 1639]MCK7611116.1 hypothetical protein [Roseibium sp. CAU 1639]
MEEDSAASLTGAEYSDLLEQIHRELAGLDMPCTCKSELDRTIRAIETWHRLKTRAELTREIAADYRHLAAGISFLTDLGQISTAPLSSQELRDHAESLLFLSSLASRCSGHLVALAKVAEGNPDLRDTCAGTT